MKLLKDIRCSYPRKLPSIENSSVSQMNNIVGNFLSYTEMENTTLFGTQTGGWLLVLVIRQQVESHYYTGHSGNAIM